MKTINEIIKSKNRQKLTMLTCYDYSFARLISSCENAIDMILVGDSLSNVIKGDTSTVNCNIDDVIYHCRAVRRGAPDVFIVADMPFMSYQPSPRDAVINAGRLISEGGANAVKIEGGKAFLPHVRLIVDAGIPVMGHLGFTPQSVNMFGNSVVRGRKQNESDKILEDALLLEKEGVFSIVLECIPHILGKKVTEQLQIPTVGIGAGVDCDGQVLVIYDMLGISGGNFKFVKKFKNLDIEIIEGINQYACSVRNAEFPSEENSFR
ncbi:MAG: 3-methyl-2-oxobutanoate hydroxymethyltransferase [Candidatus Muiribacteriota bacterium]